MVQKKITVKNRAGLHARPAAMVVTCASKFKAAVNLEKGSEKIDAKSILGILTMGVGFGSEILISADGPDEQEALDAMVSLFENKFEED